MLKRWSSSATRKIRGSSRDTFIGTNHIHPIGILNRIPVNSATSSRSRKKRGLVREVRVPVRFFRIQSRLRDPEEFAKHCPRSFHFKVTREFPLGAEGATLETFSKSATRRRLLLFLCPRPSDWRCSRVF
ncbi:uncharacterized protein LOC105698510 isoform X2 [Orussus abietinus]|uniref:uncharacterized protein LOC105698510 isoform X2 n=1 Tax=Orussus abietinus TaxID=222816 RepID=UPI000626D86D|nr:uncharacterized protein LOC105698510 isoform X2 [Orussus abietinus]